MKFLDKILGDIFTFKQRHFFNEFRFFLQKGHIKKVVWEIFYKRRKNKLPKKKHKKATKQGTGSVYEY